MSLSWKKKYSDFSAIQQWSVFKETNKAALGAAIERMTKGQVQKQIEPL